MKKLIALFSGMIIAAGAAAQVDRTGPQAVQSGQTGSVDRQAPVNSDRTQRDNPAAEDPESANSVSTDFQGTSKQESTASGMGKPKKDSQRASKADKTDSGTQDVEEKSKK